MPTYAFKEDLPRDVNLLMLVLNNGCVSFDEICAVLMTTRYFPGGPDEVLAYSQWIADPKRRRYRQRVAAEIQKG